MTALAIVESRADRASVHICDQLRDLADWAAVDDDTRPAADGGGTYYRTDGVELRSFDEFHLDLEYPVDAFDCDPDLLVFASRHSGDTGPLLTGHFTGNFGPAEFGGEADAVAEACPNALARLLEAFDEYAPERYDVGMECTHHGPTDVGCPSLFAELGSGDEQWDDPDGAAAVARAILELRNVSPHRDTQIVGFGGNHYAPRFTRVVRETPWAVGHIAADWALEAMGHPDTHRNVLEAAFDASEAEMAVIDGEWPVLEDTLEALGVRIVSETWLRESGDRSLALIDAVETALGAVDDGVRFGDRRAESVAVVDLPTELVDAANGFDPAAVRRAVEANSVAFTTDNGGSRVGSRVAVPDPPESADSTDSTDTEPARAAIIEALAGVLEEKYETVTLCDDAVVAERTSFDPALARTLGVPEGPKFGALANGDAVTVDGKTISPETVRSQQTDQFPI
ncbi:D-aminoacyl-tRNA deacylase [Natronorubrum thiooxidans]|uniref:D-aminoacyl-tRNA deacylase n=1 Tax=Natronorubrum thiooxidans TaxID=308853 RepID=A0A1N7G0Z7_9EURY|nr:D-aminoacyl-tRNA deacylase [Natronorubrum thiooxidans]SIS06231.1 D-aminoacyl-tRNA deacylase [Natronorubrum thiooxidans]